MVRRRDRVGDSIARVHESARVPALPYGHKYAIQHRPVMEGRK